MMVAEDGVVRHVGLKWEWLKERFPIEWSCLISVISEKRSVPNIQIKHIWGLLEDREVQGCIDCSFPGTAQSKLLRFVLRDLIMNSNKSKAERQHTIS